jgi:hypothetical protein
MMSIDRRKAGVGAAILAAVMMVMVSCQIPKLEKESKEPANTSASKPSRDSLKPKDAPDKDTPAKETPAKEATAKEAPAKETPGKETGPAKMPAQLTEADYAKLAKDSLLEFNKSIQAKDFTSFYNSVAKFWRDQTSPAELQKAFQAFIDQKIDISPIDKLKPEWDLPPAVEKDIYLTLTGHYDTKPSAVAYELKYQNEKGAWKLIGIDVRVYAADQMVPFDSVLGAMARETLLDFNKAITAKNFTAFHKNISKVWQKQITPKKLMDAFQVFVDNNIDISDVADTEPEIDENAAIDKDGVLAFTGNFPTKPNKVMFELKYIQEKGTWKLLGINVNVK